MFAQYHQQRVTSSSSATCSSSSSLKNQSERKRYAFSSRIVTGVQGQNRSDKMVVKSAEGEDANIPANCSRVSVEVRKPLGLILEEDGLGGIVVVEVVPEGNCAKTKLIQAGDKILAISAQIKTRVQDYGGVSVGSGEEMIRLQVQGEKFDTIMAAIGSYPSQKRMKIDVLKCSE
jgi:C-terminal processing protease CtpA/Prc